MDRVYTADELRAFPADWHYELIQGRLRLIMPTGFGHGMRTNRLATAISVYVYANDLGECTSAETGFLLSRNPDTVKAPDFAFVIASRVPATPAEGYAALAPDLVIETRSPSDRLPAIETKIREWLNDGVRVVIDLDPQRHELTVHRANQSPAVLGATDTLTLDDLLPGFVLPLGRLLT
jgi:Uma2 family endonuclease